MSRNVLVVAAGLLVFLVVAGAVYLQILVSARQTDAVWAVVNSVSAGDELSARNIRVVRIPRTGDDWDYYTGDLLQAHKRAVHQMAGGTLIFNSDVMEQEQALVTLSLKTAPPLTHAGEAVRMATLKALAEETHR